MRCNEFRSYFEGSIFSRRLGKLTKDELEKKIAEKMKPRMIKNEENCFPVKIYEENKIIFNISEIYPDIENGT